MKQVKCFLVSGFLFLAFFAMAQPQAINLNEFVQETQLNSGENGELKIAWWIPVEFWEIVLTQDKSLPAEQAQEMIEKLKPYSMIAIIDGKMGAFSTVEYTPKSKIRNNLSLTANNGKRYKPLLEDDLNSEITILLATFKPILKSMMGEMGGNMHFFVFDDQEGGKRIFDPRDSGAIQLSIGEEKQKWDLPLGTLMSPKMCPVDRKEMNGKWTFCPFHGKKLVNQ